MILFYGAGNFKQCYGPLDEGQARGAGSGVNGTLLPTWCWSWGPPGHCCGPQALRVQWWGLALNAALPWLGACFLALVCHLFSCSILLTLGFSPALFNYREQVRVSSSHPWDLLNYVETSGPWYFCLSRSALHGLRTSRSLFTCYFLRSSEFSHPVSYVALEIERIVNFRSLTHIKTTNPGLIYQFLGKIFSDTPPFLKWVPVIDLLLAVCPFPQNHFLSSCEHAL